MNSLTIRSLVLATLAFSTAWAQAPAQNQAAPAPLPTNPQPANAPGNAAANQPPAPANQPQAAGAMQQQPGGAGLTATDDELVQIKLPDADLDTILSALEIYTGRIVLRPAALPTTTYNLVFNRPVPKSEAILAIETVLALNQVSVVPMGDRFLKIVNLLNARTEAPEMIPGTTLDRPPSGRVGSKVFQFEFLRVGEFLPMLQGMLNPQYGGPIALPNANAALITDSISNLQRVERLAQQLDQPLAGSMTPKFYQLTQAKASDVVSKLRTILTGTLQVQLGQATTYNADDRTNQIILMTDPRQYPIFDDLIAKLDVRAEPNTRNEVIYLNHAKASDVVNVVSRIISQQTAVLQRESAGSVRPGQPLPQQVPPGAPTPQPLALPGAGPTVESLLGPETQEFSGIVTVVNDDRSNSVVVSGTTSDIDLIRELVSKLDIVLAQVRLEVVIAEVSLEDNHQTGISSLGLVIEGDKLVGFSGAAEGLAIEGTLIRPGLSGGWDLATEIAIGTTPRKSNNNIVSRPAVVTSHGKPGKIFYGESRPVITGTTTIPGATTAGGLTTSSQVTQQEIGTTLTVTPFIGQDGSVQLDIVQDVQEVTGTVTVDGNTQYVVGKRNSTSYVTAKSGDILVFSGFEKHSDIGGSSRLGPIPFLGDLFGKRTKNRKRQEMIFFLRPTVLTNNPNVDNADALRQIETFPNRDTIKRQLDPQYPPKS